MLLGNLSIAQGKQNQLPNYLSYWLTNGLIFLKSVHKNHQQKHFLALK